MADKGYHSGAALLDLKAAEVRTYIPEPDRGKRKWEGKTEERDAVYANRRRTGGDRGGRLRRSRSELVERSMAHMYETGGMRTLGLRGSDNILKRLLVHAGGFNLALVMRKMTGIGKPRRLQGKANGAFAGVNAAIRVFGSRLVAALADFRGRFTPEPMVFGLLVGV